MGQSCLCVSHISERTANLRDSEAKLCIPFEVLSVGVFILDFNVSTFPC
jgi:hypothetical protein